MKAFVLAAGAGTRLRPLTSNLPKPMVPILGHPALYYTLENLKKNGFKEIYINLFYRPKAITKYFNKENLGLSLYYSYEKKLLGTAGAVKKNEKVFDETFVVMSGDGLTDINLKKALAFHKKNKSVATIVLKKIDARFEYGITVTDKSGKIKSFIEKPKWGDIFTNTVNTGIYIFEPEIFDFIPKKKFFDFSMDLFPLLLKNKKRIYGYIMDEYWTDIGNIYEYKKGVFDILDGKLNIDISSGKKTKKIISKSAKIDKSVKIYGPCFIDENVVIGKNSIIRPYSVISKNCILGKDVEVEKTIIWRDSKIGNNVSLSDTIIGNNAQIHKGINLFDSIMMS